MTATTRTILATLAILSPAGCGNALGPERPPTTAIRGRILMEGRPVGPGWLEMIPVEGTLGRLRSAPVAEDGTFSASDVPVGTVAYRLAGRPLPPSGRPDLDRFLARVRRDSILRLKVPEGPRALDLTIDLRDQMLALQRIHGPNF